MANVFDQFFAALVADQEQDGREIISAKIPSEMLEKIREEMRHDNDSYKSWIRADQQPKNIPKTDMLWGIPVYPSEDTEIKFDHLEV